MIDGLFGSKTRVKLLRLFLNHPDESMYVREITRKIDEQINSVRRELSNMVTVGIIKSDTSENKLYYSSNHKYEHYAALRAIFSEDTTLPVATNKDIDWSKDIAKLLGVRLAIAAGTLVGAKHAPADLVLVGSANPLQLKRFIKKLEQQSGQELNYALLGFEDFHYRRSIRDKFITEFLASDHMVVYDPDHILSK